MTFAEILAKLTRGRYRCAADCCGDGYAAPCARAEIGFDTVLLARLIAACVMFSVALIGTKLKAPLPLVLLLASSLVAGYDLIAAAIISVMRRRWFDKSVIIVCSAVLAFALGFRSEGAALVLLFQIGGVFIDYAFTRTRLSVMEAVSCQADKPVTVLSETGEETAVPAESVPVGAHIELRPGDTVPCDCIVLQGGGSLDLSPLGAGAEPLFVSEGDELLSGCAVLTGSLRCEVTMAQGESAAAMLTAAVINGAASGDPVPGRLRRYIELFAPVVLILGILAAGIIPLVYDLPISESLRRALTIFIMANPCALLIAAPLVRLASIGGSAKSGMLFKNCSVLDACAHTGAVAFDRAGTLSDGSPRVTAVKSSRLDADTLLKITAHAMAYSSDKLARSVISAYGGTIYIELVSNFVEYPGSGVEVYVDNVRICAGSYDLMESKGIAVPVEDITDEQVIYVSVADEYAGRILLADGLRRDAALGVSELADQGVDVAVMFTDEPAASAAKTAADLGIREYYPGSVGPRQFAELEELRKGLPEGGRLMLVRSADAMDGSHSCADVDAAMVNVDSLSAIGASDLTLIGGVCGVSTAIAAAKSSERLLLLTMLGVLLIKLVVMVLAFFGYGSAWFAVFMDAAAALGAILLSITAYNGRLSLPSMRK